MSPYTLLISLSLVAVASPALAADGAKLFQSQCAMCHKPAVSTPLAPALKDVVGRKIASRPDFTYSSGLKAKQGDKWTVQNLYAFLAAPVKFAPGTRMPMNVADAANRAALIAYLRTIK